MILWNLPGFWGAFKTGISLQLLLDFCFCVCDFLRMEPFPPFGRISFLEHVPSIEELHIQESTLLDVSQNVHPRSLTVRPWKWMVGRLFSFWDSHFSGAIYVKFQVGTNLKCHLFFGLIGGFFMGLLPPIPILHPHSRTQAISRTGQRSCIYGLTTWKTPSCKLHFCCSDTCWWTKSCTSW